MNTSPELERGYRELLALYSPAFRREHEEEMLAVLMAGASPGQTRPTWKESADLHWNAMRERFMSHQSWATRHRPEVWIWVRLAVSLWLVVLTAALCANGYWWSLLLLLAVAAHLLYVVRLRAAVRARARRQQPGDGEPPLSR